jgi:hypothetical protein
VLRLGTVAKLDFLVILTTEIDGTIYLLENDVERGLSDVNIELLDEQCERVATTTSSWDDFHIVPRLVTGDYWLRLLPPQLQCLGQAEASMKKLKVSGDGSFISVIDLQKGPMANKKFVNRAPCVPTRTTARGQAYW